MGAEGLLLVLLSNSEASLRIAYFVRFLAALGMTTLCFYCVMFPLLCHAEHSEASLYCLLREIPRLPFAVRRVKLGMTGGGRSEPFFIWYSANLNAWA